MKAGNGIINFRVVNTVAKWASMYIFFSNIEPLLCYGSRFRTKTEKQGKLLYTNFDRYLDLHRI